MAIRPRSVSTACDARVAGHDPRDRDAGQDPDGRAGEVLEVGPHDRVVVDDGVVVQHGPRDRIAAAEDGQMPQGVVGRQEPAADTDPVMHLDDRAHPLDLVVVVQDPRVAESIEEDIEAEFLAHPVVLGLAREGDVGQLLGQLHRPDPRDVAAGRAAARVAALEDDDVADAPSGELPGEPEAADPGADDHDLGRGRQRTVVEQRAAVRPASRCLVVAGDEVAETDRTERRARRGQRDGFVIGGRPRRGRRRTAGSTCPGTARSGLRSVA